MWEYIVKFNGPYNFDLLLNRLGRDPLHAVNKEEKIIKVPLQIQNERRVVEVQFIGTTDDPAFSVSSINAPKSEQNVILKKLTDIFQWDKSLSKLQDYFAKTELAPLFQSFAGAPIINEFDPYRCLVKCIIHQQLNLKFAATLSERLVKGFGEEVEGVWFYPTPEKVSSLTVEELRVLQFSERKAEYLIQTSEKIASGQLDLEQLGKLSDEEITKQLTALRGIGPWTAENMLLFAYGREDIYPVGDIGIQNALKKLLNLEKKPSKDMMIQLGEKWAPYRSYATLYLWLSMENEKVRSESK
jgi:DNA-3-methyladenine glycosylase II